MPQTAIFMFGWLFVFPAVVLADQPPAHIAPLRNEAAASIPSNTRGAIFFESIGGYHRSITTSSQKAQQFFDQGLTWVFAFNHDEAIRSFQEAARLDPACAMAWWGIALSNGPHINNMTVAPEKSKAAWEALQKAAARKPNCSDIERAMIDALSFRYAESPPADRKPLDAAYASAMRELWKAHPKDADVGALTAEAMMNVRPWDLWISDGKPQPGTPDILKILAEVQQLNPKHIGALHLLIHAVEASPQPEQALHAADALRDLVPISGHLVHMPSHIYARIGRWEDAAKSNVAAMEADRKYRAQSPRQDFYRFYMSHNAHFLAWASMMQGRSAAARQAARQLIEGVPADYAKDNAAVVDSFLAIELEVFMRFGLWGEILSQPAPPSYLPITTALRFFARGVAMAAVNNVSGASVERKALQECVAKIPDDLTLGNNLARDCLAIALHVIDGEIALAEGRLDDSIAAFEKGVQLEDSLRYNEAPDWIQPVRHPLGAVLLRANQASKAEQVYREDLKRWPENGWALFGLAQALRVQGSHAEAQRIEERFRKSWTLADVPMRASCLCVIR